MNFYEHWVHITRIGENSLEPFSADEWGYIADETGLGYYRPIDDEGFVVTHLASGFAIADFASEMQARTFIDAITPLTDWTQPAKTLFALPQLTQEVRRADTVITGVVRKSTRKSRKLAQLAREIAEQAG